MTCPHCDAPLKPFEYRTHLRGCIRIKEAMGEHRQSADERWNPLHRVRARTPLPAGERAD